ncbi:hypothetical protein J1N10_20480 [Carboxylicivirga sp. A043]|uniref:hypothetical protein n=1 Tax=Carboxylicivirga litoralis TaxID=2816963 RepID=UPI0021CB007B|nr:hypothetical protein [Carboxylicivirga sp. A043]MCU4158360.1 hypothetical protein [Carboxylicivirga sp. A043]
MTRIIIFLIFLITVFQSSLCQTDKVNVIFDDGKEIDTITWEINSYKTYYSSVDLSPWSTLKDSGIYDNKGMKTDFWIEYPIDTTIMFSANNIRTDSLKSKVYNPKLVKLTGKYSDGKRYGTWNTYSYSNYIDSKWILDATTNYKDGLKNGMEISFYPWTKDTFMIVIYENEEPIELKEFYTGNRVKQIIKTENGKSVHYQYNDKGEILDKRIIK